MNFARNSTGILLGKGTAFTFNMGFA
uniref:Uncharacterized protein n=1 Tax=Rhizophora mucronata TaxID=61149 RepID=A0A2P2N6K3_RHIMU